MMIGLDFETKSDVDIKKHGLGPYFASPAFEILWAGVATERGRSTRIDFIQEQQPVTSLRNLVFGNIVCAHNVSFERMCLQHLGLLDAARGFRDSAVIARGMGAGGHLANAAPQLLGVDKMEEGMDLIKKFSIPQADGTFMTDHMEDWTQQDFDDWALFGEYCELDGKLSREIVTKYGSLFSDQEWAFEALTDKMNQRGWSVDLDSVARMNLMYKDNLKLIEADFHSRYTKVNFRSSPQLKKFCHERGVRVTSLDELHVGKYLTQVTKKLNQLLATTPKTAAIMTQVDNLREVRELLLTKQQLGGSSLSKLETIIAMTDSDGQLRNQYMHVGAGQTYRTSGRGVQMQNLRRLSTPKDMWELEDYALSQTWTNDDLARNMRQVFTASHHDGKLVVGDFASVESRGLAILAGAEWKVDAYFDGKDMYKVLAEKMTGTPYDNITKDQRQMGKVGELSCGYGAGPGAVQSFAEKMGVDIEAEEAAQIVTDWRASNPEVVQMWESLNTALTEWVSSGGSTKVAMLSRGRSLRAVFAAIETPDSITKLYPKAKTLRVSVQNHGVELFARVFQGVHLRGTDVCYLKPNENKSGPQWKAKWTKAGQSGYYKLYGGKLAGILTQSFCREIFFQQAQYLEDLIQPWKNCTIIGQFHDELVVDWHPGTDPDDSATLHELMLQMENAMSFTTLVKGFPMAADVKCDYRYIK